MTFARPEVFLSEEDHAALRRALERLPAAHDGARLLAGELARARVLPAERLPRDAVRLNSAVAFLDNEALEIGEAVVVLPEAARGPGLAAATSPLGAALIGLRVGATMRWLSAREGPRAVTITRVEPPPEPGRPA
jgi:regulator of nucleoside diphosphate kinase